jgi:protease-4
LVAQLGAIQDGHVATVQEIRDAIVRFRQEGQVRARVLRDVRRVFKRTRGSYYLATAFDEVWMQPSGDVGMAGLFLESPFLRGVLDKVGVKPRMDQRKEYKNALNMFTEKSFTPAHREAMTKIGDSIYGQLVRAISDSRKLSEAEVRATIDRGPLLGAEAMTAKLVDKLGYHDEFYAAAKQRAGQGAELLYLHKYRERVEPLHKKGPKVALIYGVGGVARGKSSYDPLSGDVSMGSDTVAAGFRAAIADKDVKAILFRVNSPGGSYVASDVIWQEVGRARRGRQAGGCLDGQRRGLGRLLCGDGGRQDRRGAGNHHRIDWRPGRQAGPDASCGKRSGCRSTRFTLEKTPASFR